MDADDLNEVLEHLQRLGHHTEFVEPGTLERPAKYLPDLKLVYLDPSQPSPVLVRAARAILVRALQPRDFPFHQDGG